MLDRDHQLTEAEARAINAEPWDPLPGMVKRQCTGCRYLFAVSITAAPEPLRCPDCAVWGTK